MTVAVVVPSLGMGGCEMYAADLATELQQVAPTHLVCNAAIVPAMRRRTGGVELHSVATGRGHPPFAEAVAAHLSSSRPEALVAVLPLPVEEEGTVPDPLAILEAAAGLAIPTTAIFQLCHRAFPATPAARTAADRLTRAQEWVTVSQDNRRHLAATFGIPTDRLSVIPNGVRLDCAQRPRPGLRSELGIDGGALLLTVGRMVPSKRHEDAVDALCQLPGDVHLAVAGAGPERSALLARARAIGVDDRVALLGHRGDVPSLLADADVFVFPSVAEGASFALLEAMAAGLPVVASAHGSNAEIIRDEVDGCLHLPRSPEDLAAKLRRLLADPPARRSLGQAAKARVEQCYDRVTMIRDTTRLVLRSSVVGRLR